MRITADTNLLVRALTRDDAEQAALAEAALEGAQVIALPSAMLCELVWVLRRGYRLPADEVAAALRDLLAMEEAVVDRAAAAAGLAHLEAGGDFADGVIAHQGRGLGAAVLVTFDRAAAAIERGRGHGVRVLKEPE